MNFDKEKEIFLVVLGELLDRKGFDSWWEDIEEEYQQEIEQLCIKAIREILEK